MNATKSRLGSAPTPTDAPSPKSRLAASTKGLDAAHAVRSAVSYFNSLFGKTGNLLLPEAKPSLEEIERSKDGHFWLVTLGYDAPRRHDPNLPTFLRVPARKLKIFKVNAVSGEVVAMKMHPAE